MKVSVIIPAYNEEKYILNSINSIIHQSYFNYEVIIVDNNSTDSTWKKIVDLLNGKCFMNMVSNNGEFTCNIHGVKFRLIKEYNRGTNNARECGRLRATGDIIAFVDADCKPSYHWISNGVLLLKDKSVAAASGAYYFYDDKPIRRLFSLYTQILIYKPLSFILQYFKKGAIINGGNIFIKSSVLESLGGLNTNLSFYGDDVDTAKKAIRYGKVLFSTSVTMPTSSRRFKELGYRKTNKKYMSIFIRTVFGKALSADESKEVLHPR